MIYEAIINENKPTEYLESLIKGYLKEYYYGQIDSIMLRHKISMAVGYNDPSWSYEDFKTGREKNNIPLTA